MRRKAILLAAVTAVLVGAASWLLFRDGAGRSGVALAEIDIEAGKTLYGENCASCHGENLEGQPDWRSPGEDGRLPAPPHDFSGHTWHHPDGMIFDYTKLGGKAALASQGLEFDSGMPGFEDVLTDQQIHNILAFIRSTWPDRIREVQAARTEADEQRGEN